MRKPSFIQALLNEIKQTNDDGQYEGDQAQGMAMKEAYVCKRMKIDKKKLYNTCIITGVNTLYDELRKGSGAK